MKKHLFILASFLFTQSLFAHSVKIRFTDTNRKDGEILYAIFNDRGEFPKGKTFDEGAVRVVSEIDGAIETIDLPEGEYAISVFLDENQNKKLDTNVIGIPKERFGFSNNPKILTGPPGYTKCKFTVTADKEIRIKLITLLDQ